jgi:hypothetical protein
LFAELLECDPASAARAAAPPASVVYADPNHVREPETALGLAWLAAQLLPSPELGFGSGTARFGMRWQLTPVLYSFGVDPRLSRWRWFVVEPLVRQSGSLELHVSPVYLALDGTRIGARVGPRAYFPLIQRGDYLSVSVGSGYLGVGSSRAAYFELGAYVLFGLVGLQVTYAPAFEPAPWFTTLALRIF